MPRPHNHPFLSLYRYFAFPGDAGNVTPDDREALTLPEPTVEALRRHRGFSLADVDLTESGT